MQQAALGAIGESLIDCQVAGEHNAHVVRPVENFFGFKGSVEVSGKVKQPRTLRANLRTDKADTLVPVPVLPASPASSDFRFNFNGMIVGFRDTAGDASIPRVTVASLGEDGGVAL